MNKDCIEYKLISSHYGTRTAKRSQVPLINHINEGLVILEKISATEDSKQAFCLHPLLQADDDLSKNFEMVVDAVSSRVILLTMEYRNIANAWLSDKALVKEGPKLSPLLEVNDMLVADKVQNYKDFIAHHQGTHERSRELTIYFERWLEALKITTSSFEFFCQTINQSKS